MSFSVYVNFSEMDTSGSALVADESIEIINAVPNKLFPGKYKENKLVTLCVNQKISTWLYIELIYRKLFKEPLPICVAGWCQFNLNSSSFRSILDYAKLTLILLMVAYIWRIECSHCTVATEYINRCVA